MPKPKQPTQAEQIIEFAKMRSNSAKHKDHYISTTVGPLLNRKIYCVEWGFDDEEEGADYWCYVAAPLDGSSNFEYFDDEGNLFHSLSVAASELDNVYRVERFRQITALAFDIFAGVIAVAITGAVIAAVFLGTKDTQQLWSIFAVIIGYYFGRAVTKSTPAERRPPEPVPIK